MVMNILLIHNRYCSCSDNGCGDGYGDGKGYGDG